MMKSIISVTGLVAAASAFTQPVQPPTYGSLLRPDVNNAVTTGQTFEVTWQAKQPADGVTVSLVLCNGPGANCVLQNTAIAEGIPASAQKFSWNVPCSLPEGVQSTATGYGMLIIVDGTGEFQYSTQFSVNKGASCSGSTTTTSSATSSSSDKSSTSASKPSTSSYPDGGASWGKWTTSTVSSSTTTPVVVSTSKHSYTTQSPVPVPVTSTSYIQTTPSATTPSLQTTSAVSTFTGAAPTAFANVAGIVGAALLAGLAL